MKLRIILLAFILLPAQLLFSQLSQFSTKGWFPQFHDTTKGLSYLFFINENTGWAVGYKGCIVNTTNGGEIWISQISGTREWLESVYFINPDTGFIGSRGFILMTVNSGLNWDKIIIDTLINGNKIVFFESYFPCIDTGYFLGGVLQNGGDVFWYHWYFLKSYDGLKSFEIVDKGDKDTPVTQYYNLYFPNRNFFHEEKIGYKRITSGTYSKTYDDGITWKFMGPFNFIYFVNSNVGYGLVNHSYGYDLGHITIVKTTTGGE